MPLGAGTEANGYFFVAWAVAMALDVALVNAASSWSSKAGAAATSLGALVLSLLRTLTVLTIPIVSLVFLAAYPILLLYGSSYAENGSTLLRIVAISVLPRIVVVVWMSMNRVTGQLGRILFVEVRVVQRCAGPVVVPASHLRNRRCRIHLSRGPDNCRSCRRLRNHSGRGAPQSPQRSKG